MTTSAVTLAVLPKNVASSWKVYVAPGTSASGMMTRLGLVMPDKLMAARSTPADGTIDHESDRGEFVGSPSGGRAVPRSASFEDGFCLRALGKSTETVGSAPLSTVMLTARSMGLFALGAGFDTRRPKAKTPVGRALPSIDHIHVLVFGGSRFWHARPACVHDHANRMPPPHRPVA